MNLNGNLQTLIMLTVAVAMIRTLYRCAVELAQKILITTKPYEILQSSYQHIKTVYLW